VFGLTGLMFLFSITSILYKYLSIEEDENDSNTFTDGNNNKPK